MMIMVVAQNFFATVQILAAAVPNNVFGDKL